MSDKGKPRGPSTAQLSICAAAVAAFATPGAAQALQQEGISHNELLRIQNGKVTPASASKLVHACERAQMTLPEVIMPEPGQA